MTTFAITKAHPTVGGVAKTPSIGDWYGLTVEFTVTGTPKNPYHVYFSMADQYETAQITDLTPGTKTATKQFRLPLDGKIPWEIEIDPFKLADADDPTKSKIPPDIPDIYGHGSRSVTALKRRRAVAAGSRTAKGSFEPGPPAKGIGLFDPVWAVGAQSQFQNLAAGGKIDRAALMMGCPVTESWQTALSSVCKVESGSGDDLVAHRPVENASQYPVFYWNRTNVPVHDISAVQQFALKLQNMRVDASLLRAVTWAQLDALAPIDVFAFYRSPETVVESKHPKVTAFVKQTLGANHRNHMTPYDAARKLFQAVLAHTTYYFPAPNTEDKRPSTAVGMLDKGFGDCGGFSILLVALYRNIGFPARTACGAWIGQDSGHCWCEMYFPGHGWMVSDGSAGNAWSESGKYAYCFGNLLDLNARYATMRGNTFNVADIKTSWLQAPWGPAVWGTAKIASGQGHTALVEVTQAEAESLAAAHAKGGQKALLASMKTLRSTVRAQPARRRREAVRACPCHQHGGFVPPRRLVLARPARRKTATKVRAG